ncbi:MAG: hypothetical protein R3F13_19915 [Prosthecobacter sp.]
MTNGNEGRKKAWILAWGAAAAVLLAGCNGGMGGLRPAWQQDPNLYHHGEAARAAQTSQTPHMVARIVYAAPDRISRMMERQGDVADAVRGLVRMGDGTIEVGLQDAATGRWLESHACGGVLFVAGLPNQAYRIAVRNRTPLPLELAVGVDGKRVVNGKSAVWKRGGPRVEARDTLYLDEIVGSPLLFQPVTSDAALYELGPKGHTGLVQIAVFLASDAPSLPPEKLRAGQVAPLGLLPVGAPEQYR